MNGVFMNDVLFEILKAVVVLAVILITRYAVPYLKQIVDNSKYEWVMKMVDVAVKAAEQTIKDGEKDKKTIVTKFIKSQLIQKNISISDEQLDNLIESAVYAMNEAKS